MIAVALDWTIACWKGQGESHCLWQGSDASYPGLVPSHWPMQTGHKFYHLNNDLQPLCTKETNAQGT